MQTSTSKASILQNIYDAKRAHKEWVRKADKLVNGLDGYQGKKVTVDVDETFIPLDSSTCEFGLWFNHYSTQLSGIPSIGNIINRIAEHHNQLHETYSSIYSLFFVVPKQRSILRKLITLNSQKVSTQSREEAQIHFKYLKRSSEELLAVLAVLEERVKDIDYTDLTQVSA